MLMIALKLMTKMMIEVAKKGETVLNLKTLYEKNKTSIRDLC